MLALAKDAAPTKFPGCPAHLTKTEGKIKVRTDHSCPPTMKWRRVRQENATSFEELSPTQTSQACDVVSDMDQRVRVGSDAAAFNTPVMMASATNLIKEVFENANNMPLQKAVWDKADVDGLRTIMFCESIHDQCSSYTARWFLNWC